MKIQIYFILNLHRHSLIKLGILNNKKYLAKEVYILIILNKSIDIWSSKENGSEILYQYYSCNHIERNVPNSYCHKLVISAKYQFPRISQILTHSKALIDFFQCLSHFNLQFHRSKVTECQNSSKSKYHKMDNSRLIEPIIAKLY